MLTLLKIWESAAETTQGSIPSRKYNGLKLNTQFPPHLSGLWAAGTV